jgi:hypothetical protein
MRTAKETIPDYLLVFPYRLVIFDGGSDVVFLTGMLEETFVSHFVA